ncbi:MAG: CDP-alcohol phosphatidyltransferase family protein [Flavobacteriales bacterium]|nr:CDP-alcohol phosphatidyltransferase family protein [Flavobacteriales bacterium]
MARFPRIPDLLTTANLACGVGSILLASQGQLTLACWLVFAGAFFDVLDGLAARALGGGTPLGVQLDSLADMVTFGVAPGMVLYLLAGVPLGSQLVVATMISASAPPVDTMLLWMQLIGIAVACIIPIASAWRLAKFNIDTRQTDGFLGLPTPANALFWASAGLGLQHLSPEYAVHLGAVSSIGPWMLIVVAVLLGVLMLSSIPLPSLKFQHFKWQGNQVIYLLLGIGAVLVVLYGILAVPLILLLYLLSPLWGKLFPKQPA